MAIGTSYIFRIGRGRYAWVTMIPCIFLAVITCYADYLNIFTNYIPTGKWLLVVISAIMFILVAVVMVEAIRSWIRYAKTVKQDYRTREEIEAETKAELQKQGKLDLVK